MTASTSNEITRQSEMRGEESMDTRNTKPSAWHYGLGALVLLLGCAIAVRFHFSEPDIHQPR
jgi:hypothetical protein